MVSTPAKRELVKTVWAFLVGASLGFISHNSAEAPLWMSIVAIGVWAVLARFSWLGWNRFKVELGPATALAAVSLAWALLAAALLATGALFDSSLRNFDNSILLVGSAAMTPLVTSLFVIPVRLLVAAWRRLSRSTEA